MSKFWSRLGQFDQHKSKQDTYSEMEEISEFRDIYDPQNSSHV